MAATQKTQPSDIAKIVLLACVIVIALIVVIVTYVQSNATSGTVQNGPVQHIRASARDKPRNPSAGAMNR